MVVQCTSCQAKFRIADDKVTERGVRVRCTSCKNVFQVKKPGATGVEGPGPGSTMELSALDAAALTRPAPRNQALGAGRAAAAGARAPAPAPAKPPPRPAAPPARAPAGSNGARRLDADDLFGMAELTGDSPVSIEPSAPPPRAPPPSRAPKPPAAAARPMPSFDDIELEVDDAPLPPAPATARPQVPARRTQAPFARAQPASAAVPLPTTAPPEPLGGASVPPPRPLDPFEPAIAATPSPPPPPPPPDDGFKQHAAGPPAPPADDESDAVTLGAFKTQLKDPFEGMNLGTEGTGALELSTTVAAKKDDKPAGDKPATPPGSVAEEPQAPYSASREMVSSALTGLVGAALAVAVVLGVAFSDDTGGGWLGFGGGSDIVATRVVSGLYDTIAGKPVFYVRGRVENRGKKMRGPIRVIAELVTDSGTDAHADTIAGAEPTPEAVFDLRTSGEADKLNRSLELSEVERRVAPGASLPFFAVIADPPADLEHHKLHVRVEPVDAWVPPAATGKGAKGR